MFYYPKYHSRNLPKISIRQLNKKMENNDLYTRIMWFFFYYPQLIDFCKYIHTMHKDTFIAFLSRDAYFCYLLYKQMYSHMKVNKDFDYIMSSRKCFDMRDSNSYYQYLKKITKNKKKLLLIDIYGRGVSFLKFVNHYNFENIHLLFFLHNSLDHKYLKIKKNKKKVTSFLLLDRIEDQPDKKHPCFIEKLYRAPHPKVISITENYKPVFLQKELDEHDTDADIYQQYLIKIYRNTLNKMKYNKKIRYLTYSNYIQNISINIENINYIGLLALDIDDTIENIKDYKYIRKIIKICSDNFIKVILVTARQIPYKYGEKNKQKNSIITDILDSIMFNYNKNIIDIWYNPFYFLDNGLSASTLKYLQIKKTLNDYNLKNTDCIFFDDTQKHINKCYDKGINSVLVKKGIGIDKKCLNIFKKTFKIKINKDKIIY